MNDSDTDTATNSGRTPLMIACWNEHLDVAMTIQPARYLLASGSDPLAELVRALARDSVWVLKPRFEYQWGCRCRDIT